MQFHEHKPIYLQIADYIINQILKNQLSAGDRIPSVRELAITAEVTPNTAMRAFQFLQDKNIIFNKRGIGYFVAPEALNIAKQIKLDEFVNEQLPIFFKQMEILNLDFDSLKKYYDNFKNTQK
jgi:DNA-binding transcriptional regulator YhcF (GntR family)